MAKKKAKRNSVPRQYESKVRIPLPFDVAIGGLLAVKPEEKRPEQKKNGSP
jgi:hypothetical protein